MFTETQYSLTNFYLDPNRLFNKKDRFFYPEAADPDPVGREYFCRIWMWPNNYGGAKNDAHTKRPKTKRPKGPNVPSRVAEPEPPGAAAALGTPKGQKVLGTKRPKGQNVPRDKTSQGQNVPRTKRPKDKTSQGTKRPMGTNEDHYLTCVANYLIWVIWD